ncbi:MAG: methyltransferase domain-containing protein [Hyphomicrobiales bacterium]|nr:methyltransferase domain-containing protein [Hyphomicrobiales bacterium]
MGRIGRALMPRLVDTVCGIGAIAAQRQKVVPLAKGVVVEIGIGTGRNLSFYDADCVSRLIGINPPDHLTRIAEKRALDVPFGVEILLESAEAMSLETATADSVVITYTMCSIPQVETALDEIRRILKPGGRLLLSEHGRSPRTRVARWQDRLTPAWKLVAGGCHLNRDVKALVEAAGFGFEHIERFPLKRVPEMLGYHTVGVARRR